MLFEIKNRWTMEVIFSLDCDSIKLCVEAAVEKKINLRRANLSHANLSDAYLSDANLSGAYLSGAQNAEVAIAKTRILPQGSIIGWKAANGHIVKLLIPMEAKRSHAFGRKCRAEYADVLEIEGAEVTYTCQYGPKTEYKVGQRVFPDKWSDDWQNECSNGIHFFITREEAQEWL